MMITDTAHGRYPYAGIPWFSTPFGRDGFITAMELLWAEPGSSRAACSPFLAEDAGGRRADDAQDAQPGKILHEMRDGEMAALGEVPFGRYYGSADATPLFVMLAARVLRAHRRISPSSIRSVAAHPGGAGLDATVAAIVDGDGFIEYARQSRHRSRPAGVEGF